MTVDRLVRHEIPLDRVDIDPATVEPAVGLRPDTLAHLVVGEQSVGVLDLPVERAQPFALHRGLEDRFVHVVGQSPETVAFVLPRPVLLEVLGHSLEFVLVDYAIEFARRATRIL